MRKSRTLLTKAVGIFLIFAFVFVSMLSLPLSVNAADVGDIYLRGSFTGWEAHEGYKMKPMGDDNFMITATLSQGSHQFKFANMDWSYNTPADNITLNLSTSSTIVFEVNTRTGLYAYTIVKGDSQMLQLSDTVKKVRLSSAWHEHLDEYLCESSAVLSYTTNASSADSLWNIVPTDEENLFYIQNTKSQNYIALVDGEAACVKDGNTTDNGKWYIDLSTGNYRILNKSDFTKSINLEAQNGKAFCSYTPAYYTSSQFKLHYTDYSYTLSNNGVTDTRGNAIAKDSKTITSYASGKEQTWTLKTDISSAPSLSAPNSPLLEAVYNLSVEETFINQFESKYGTAFYTGENWKKVWTRDTAMSCQYSLANIFPEISLNCAKEKVVGSGNERVFEQDTGSGGSYPVSTDKIITMLSVWEIYLTTGDTSVLEYFYDIAKNTINQDYEVSFDKTAGLFKGETCGTDWRDQTYPDWMGDTQSESLANIAEGKAASVNIIYCRVLEIMARCADILNKGDAEVSSWNNKHDELYKAITTRLWSDELGVYAAWEYPSYMGAPLPYKADVISNGYALMFGIGSEEQLKSIAENYPLVTYGAPTVYPQKQGNLTFANKVYHNRGVWPGWEATMMLGGMEVDNSLLSEEIFNSCVRGCATSLTNKEVIDFTTGEGIESSRQLWSIAGTLAGYYKVMFGMKYEEEGLVFTPSIPSWAKGPFTLDNFKYRDANLTVTLEGEGNGIKNVIMDGEEVVLVESSKFSIPKDIKGNHTIKLIMTKSEKADKVNLDDDKNHVVCPSLPTMVKNGNLLRWSPQQGCTYKLYNGREFIDLDENTTSYTIDDNIDDYNCYSLVAVSKDGIWSEMSKPIVSSPDNLTIKVEAEDGKFNSSKLRTYPQGYSGRGVVDDTMSNTSAVEITVNIPADGTYLMSCVHNNKGEPTSSNSCAIRSVYVDGKDVGTLVFPVMNFNYQTSTHLPISMTKGQHTVSVLYDSKNFYDRNMNININNVQYDYFNFYEASSIFEEPKPQVKYIIGDADENGVVDISDATVIQRKLAKLEVKVFSEKGADADQDGKITITDATTIQRHLAHLLPNSQVGKVVTE